MRTLESSLLVFLSSVALADGFQQTARLGVAPRAWSFASSTSLRVASVANNHNDSSFGSSAATASTTTLPARHVRWHSPAENTYNLQTAVTTWQNPSTGQKVELHAMVHFGDKEYYQEYNKNNDNDDALQDRNNRIVLYELLLDDTILLTSSDGFRRVAQPLGASLADQQTAARYNWACQVDVLDYQQPHWRHADWTRGEFQQALQKGRGNKAAASVEPLWQQVSSPSAATEVATALFVGPPTMSDKDSRRKLFSNLFLPGSSLASALRLALWMTVPAPELSILLLDWSSTTSSRNVWQASWSPIVRFLLQALQQARLDVIQRLAFGQVLLTGSRPTTTTSSPDGVAQSLLIQGRNQQALKVLDQTLAQDKDADVALLYGSSHCPDLSQGLRQRGFVFQSTNWRTAWSVELNNNNNDSPAPLWLIPATLYLAASGADWLASWQAVGSAGDDPSQILLLAGAYGVRHVLLYLGISKVVLDWQRPGDAVED